MDAHWQFLKHEGDDLEAHKAKPCCYQPVWVVSVRVFGVSHLIAGIRLTVLCKHLP